MRPIHIVHDSSNNNDNKRAIWQSWGGWCEVGCLFAQLIDSRWWPHFRRQRCKLFSHLTVTSQHQRPWKPTFLKCEHQAPDDALWLCWVSAWVQLQVQPSVAGHAQKKVRAPQLPRGHVKLFEVWRDMSAVSRWCWWRPNVVAMTMPMASLSLCPANLMSIHFPVPLSFFNFMCWRWWWRHFLFHLHAAQLQSSHVALATGNFRILKAKVAYEVRAPPSMSRGYLGRVCMLLGAWHIACNVHRKLWGVMSMRSPLPRPGQRSRTRSTSTALLSSMALKCLKMRVKSRTTKTVVKGFWLLISSQHRHIIENAPWKGKMQMYCTATEGAKGN